MAEGLSIWEDIKWQWRNGGMLVKLIMLNLVIWLSMILVKLFIANIAQQTELYGLIRNQFVLPSQLSQLVYRPLSFLTHMFYHEGFMHILFNLLWLFTFGKVFITFLEERRLLPVYLLSGLCGAALYLLIANFLPHFVTSVGALGASAAVMGIVFASVAMSPNYQLHFVFIGPVKIKWIALVLVVLDIVGMSAMNNVGGSVAHLGGALFGYLFVQQLYKGRDLSEGLQKLFGRKVAKSS
ncbi:rhomboid family intramembrane serine protease, partial [Chitinophagales bacterium]|nr:rhomboid family intramembrane serine protease [Chitinophagales bacterium]